MICCTGDRQVPYVTRNSNRYSRTAQEQTVQRRSVPGRSGVDYGPPSSETLGPRTLGCGLRATVFRDARSPDARVWITGHRLQRRLVPGRSGVDYGPPSSEMLGPRTLGCGLRATVFRDARSPDARVWITGHRLHDKLHPPR